MRTDLVVLWLVHEWLKENRPELAANWNLEIPDEVKAAANRLPALYDRLAHVLLAQATLANAITRKFTLKDIALLGAGVPTPLMPPPETVAYFTDLSPEAIAAGQQAGYNALVVDVREPAQIAPLKGVDTAVATGLFHFFTDEEFKQVVANLKAADITTLIFNHIDISEVGDHPIMKNFVAQMYGRTPQEIKHLIDGEVTHTYRMVEFLEDDPQFGQYFTGLQNIFNIYVVKL